MKWPGDTTVKEWLETYARSRDPIERKRLNDLIFNLLFQVVMVTVNSWRKKNAYQRLPLGQENEDYYSEICLILYKRMLGWVYGSTVSREITFPYLWRTAYGIIQDRFSQDLEEEKKRLSPVLDSEERESTPGYDRVQSPLAGPEEIIVQRDMVKRAWQRLTAIQRKIVWRFHCEDRSMTEIAKELNVSISKVSRHYGAVRKIFEEELAGVQKP